MRGAIFFGWMVAFLGSMAVIGLIPTVPVFIIAFMRLEGPEKWRHCFSWRRSCDADLCRVRPVARHSMAADPARRFSRSSRRYRASRASSGKVNPVFRPKMRHLKKPSFSGTDGYRQSALSIHQSRKDCKSMLKGRGAAPIAGSSPAPCIKVGAGWPLRHCHVEENVASPRCLERLTFNHLFRNRSPFLDLAAREMGEWPRGVIGRVRKSLLLHLVRAPGAAGVLMASRLSRSTISFGSPPGPESANHVVATRAR